MSDPGNADPLDDRAEIVDVLYRYATALDSRDWDLLREVFTEDAVGEYTGRIGRTFEGREAITGLVSSALSSLDVSQHVISNPVIQISGDTAESRCYLRAQHYMANPPAGGTTHEVGGTYHDRLVRTADGWRIVHRRLEVTWSTGNAGIQMLPPRDPEPNV